jgi:hypothetical protein
MIYQTPDPWRLERRGPQHAAPFDSSAPLRRHGGRALRLIVTAGAWGAGLCLVIGLVAMVAQGAVPRHPARLSDAEAAGGSASNTAFAQYTKRVSGIGPLLSPFEIAAHSQWELRWSYRCAAGRRGYLTISEPTLSTGVSVRATGPSARGVTWAFSDVTRHYLLIRGDCRWNVVVAGHR